jgi:hypothetical protein
MSMWCVISIWLVVPISFFSSPAAICCGDIS